MRDSNMRAATANEERVVGNPGRTIELSFATERRAIRGLRRNTAAIWLRMISVSYVPSSRLSRMSMTAFASSTTCPPTSMPPAPISPRT